MSHVKQCFWAIGDSSSSDGKISNTAGDITSSNREKIANAAAVVLTNNSDEVVSALSCGGYDNSQGPEISLVIDITDYLESADFNDLLDTLTTSMVDSLDDQFSGTNVSPTATVQDSVRYDKLSQQQTSDAADNKASLNIQASREFHASLARLPRVPATRKATHVSLSSYHIVGATQAGVATVVEGFSVTSDVYTALTSVTSNLPAIKDQLLLLQEAFDELAKETELSHAAVVMAKYGIVTIGPQMATAYNNFAGPDGDLNVIIAALISSCAGGFSSIQSTSKDISAAIGGIWAQSSDALSLMLVVNGQAYDVAFAGPDYILHGEHRVTVDTIPKAPDATNTKPMAYPCGFFAYQKATQISDDFSYYGSSSGLVLESNSSSFSVGLCSPSSVLGGNNAIRLFSGADAESAARAADKAASPKGTGTRTGESIALNGGKCTVNRAKDVGNLNYSLCALTAAA